jgi:hypothetical protein
VAVVEPDTVDEGGLESEESADVSVVLVVAVVLEVFVVSAEVVDESPSGVADATPGEVATAVPMPSATASAPTRPMCLA